MDLTYLTGSSVILFTTYKSFRISVTYSPFKLQAIIRHFSLPVETNILLEIQSTAKPLRVKESVVNKEKKNKGGDGKSYIWALDVIVENSFN